MVLERKRLKIGIEVRAQFEQCLETDFYKEVVRDPTDATCEDLNQDQNKTKKSDNAAGTHRADCWQGVLDKWRPWKRRTRVRIWPEHGDDVIDNDLERPRLQEA